MMIVAARRIDPAAVIPDAISSSGATGAPTGRIR